MIYIGIGSNLANDHHSSPLAVCQAAVDHLSAYGQVVLRSPWYESAPVPISDQPWFINAVVCYQTALEPAALLEQLHLLEEHFGRIRQHRNEARILDLDLLAYHDLVTASCAEKTRVAQTTALEVGDSVIPHPRLHQRSFVLLPLRDIAPDWVHPASGQSIEQLIESLPKGQNIRPLASVD